MIELTKYIDDAIVVIIWIVFSYFTWRHIYRTWKLDTEYKEHKKREKEREEMVERVNVINFKKRRK